MQGSRYRADTIELKEQLRFDEHSPFGRVCLKLRTPRPTRQDIDILCHRRIIGDGVSTSASVKTFHEHFPQGMSMAITVEVVAMLNGLAVQGLMAEDDFLDSDLSFLSNDHHAQH